MKGPRFPLAMDSVSLMTVVIFLVMMGFGTIGPTLSIYLETLGADFSLISIILTTQGLVSLLGHYVWGRTSDRLGRRKPIVMGGLLAMSLSLALLSVSRTYIGVWLILVVEAFALAAYSTASLALLGDWLAQDSQKGRRIGTYRGFGSIAFAVGAFVAGFIINRLGIRQAYGFASAMYLVAAFFAWSVEDIPHNRDRDQDAEAEAGARFRFGDPASLLFLLGVVLWSAAHSAQASMFPNFITNLGLPEEASSWLWGLAALVEGLLMPFIGALSDSIGSMGLIMSSGVSLALVMVGYLWLRQATVSPTLIASQILRGWGFSSFTVTSMLHASLLGNHRTRAGNVGVYGVAMSAGNIMGLALGGQLVQWRDFAFLFTVCAVAYLCSSVLFGWLGRVQARGAPAAAGQ